MANTRPLNTDPLRSFKFNVVIPRSNDGAIGSSSGSTNEARLGFMSMSGLGISIEPLTYREGGDNLTTRKMPGHADFNPITLSRGLFARDNDNWLWMQQLFTAMYGGGGAPTNFRTALYINVLEHPNTGAGALGNAYGTYNASYPIQNTIVKVSFKLYSAWITSLAYSDLDAGGNAVGVEQMTLNYEGFDMQWGGDGYVQKPNTW